MWLAFLVSASLVAGFGLAVRLMWCEFLAERRCQLLGSGDWLLQRPGCRVTPTDGALVALAPQPHPRTSGPVHEPS